MKRHPTAVLLNGVDGVLVVGANHLDYDEKGVSIVSTLDAIDKKKEGTEVPSSYSSVSLLYHLLQRQMRQTTQK